MHPSLTAFLQAERAYTATSGFDGSFTAPLLLFDLSASPTPNYNFINWFWMSNTEATNGYKNLCIYLCANILIEILKNK